jgi:plasmid stabilization system protein ParE
MKGYYVSPEARNDLEQIIEFIAQESPVAALKVLREIGAAMRKLARMPGMGHLREDLVDEPVRFWPVYSYLIVYRDDIRPIQIVRVLHGARDVRSALESGD